MNLPSINVEGSGHAVPTIINDEQTINPQQDSVYIFNLVSAEVWPHLILGTTNVPVGCKVTVFPSSNKVADFGFVTYKNIAKIDNTVFLVTGGSATFVFTNEGTWDVLSGASFYMDFATYYGISSSMKQKEPSNWKHITGSGTYYFRYADQPNSVYMLPKDTDTIITVVNGGALYNYSGSSSEFLHIPGVVIATAYTDISTSGNQKHPTIYTIGGQGNRTGSEGAYVPEITWNTSWMKSISEASSPVNVSISSGLSGKISYVIKNGWCHLRIYELARSTSGTQDVTSALPKTAQWSHLQYGTGSACWLNPNSSGYSTLTISADANVTIYGNIVYPIASDSIIK